MYRIKKYELVCEPIATYAVNSKAASPENVAAVLTSAFRLDKAIKEKVFAVVIDTKMNVNGIHEISSGCLDSSQVHPREIMQAVLSTPRCAAFILAHNHPSGDPAPSRDDNAVTERINNAAELLGIRMLDHIIVGDNGRYYSYKSDGRL